MITLADRRFVEARRDSLRLKNDILKGVAIPAETTDKVEELRFFFAGKLDKIIAFMEQLESLDAEWQGLVQTGDVDTNVRDEGFAKLNLLYRDCLHSIEPLLATKEKLDQRIPGLRLFAPERFERLAELVKEFTARIAARSAAPLPETPAFDTLWALAERRRPPQSWYEGEEEKLF